MEIFDFGKGIPSCIVAEGGSISVETALTKQGSGSLRWNFSDGDKLIIKGDVDYRKQVFNGTDYRVYTFGVYLFGFGNGEKLHISFLEENAEKTGFDINLGFEGWRSVMACFDRDMSGEATEGMNKTVIKAKGEGTLLISEMVLANKVDARMVHKSYQAPFIRNDEFRVKPDWGLRSVYKAEEPDAEAVKTVKARFLSYLYNEFANVKVTFEEIEEKVSQFEIKETKYGVSGKKTEWSNQRCIVKDTLWEKEEYVSVRRVTDVMLLIAAYYTQTKDKRAEEIYIKLLRHLMLQGFAVGSSLGTHKILDYGLRPIYFSALLMEKCIEEAGLTDAMVDTMQWFLHIHSCGFAEDIPIKLASCDDFFNSARGVLISVLMMKDAKKQAGYLRAFSDWVSASLRCRTGLKGMFKKDGTIFHHHGHYIAYGNGGLEGAAPIVWALQGTPFSINEKAYSDMKKVMESIHFMCFGSQTPMAFAGRHASSINTAGVKAFKYFALAALEKKDKKIAGLYRTMKKTPDDELDRKIFDTAVVEEKALNDNRSFPLACACVHKRENFMAVAKGFSKYLWGSEIYTGANMYGRYRSYGVLELINERNPFSHEGYDWNRFPGSTTIHLPMEKLRANILNVDSKSGVEEMLISDQSFAGSVSLEKNGMFSMILSGHPKYDGTHKAYKSVFFYDDFILLLGSGISNKSEEETETTLFQASLLEDDPLPKLCGKDFSGEKVIEKGDVLSDNMGNNYYIKEGTRVFVSSGEQISRSSADDSETKGSFATAVISHGISPENESYEYSIGVNGAEKINYQVIRCDKTAHIVKIGDVTYMAIFEPDEFDEIKVNEPILLMIRETEENINVAVCNPDLALYDEDPSQYDENGQRKEVSIYSRNWVENPIGEKQITVFFKKHCFKFEAALTGGSIYSFNFKNRGEAYV